MNQRRQNRQSRGSRRQSAQQQQYEDYRGSQAPWQREQNYAQRAANQGNYGAPWDGRERGYSPEDYQSEYGGNDDQRYAEQGYRQSRFQPGSYPSGGYQQGGHQSDEGRGYQQRGGQYEPAPWRQSQPAVPRTYGYRDDYSNEQQPYEAQPQWSRGGLPQERPYGGGSSEQWGSGQGGQWGSRQGSSGQGSRQADVPQWGSSQAGSAPFDSSAFTSGRQELHGANPATRYGHVGESHYGKGPKQYSRSDERIKEDICDELYDDEEIDAQEIEVQVKDGKVTLIGCVPERSMKHRAEDIAGSARGAQDCDNQIRVKRMGERQEGAAASERSASGASPRQAKSGSTDL